MIHAHNAIASLVDFYGRALEEKHKTVEALKQTNQSLIEGLKRASETGKDLTSLRNYLVNTCSVVQFDIDNPDVEKEGVEQSAIRVLGDAVNKLEEYEDRAVSAEELLEEKGRELEEKESQIDTLNARIRNLESENEKLRKDIDSLFVGIDHSEFDGHRQIRLTQRESKIKVSELAKLRSDSETLKLFAARLEGVDKLEAELLSAKSSIEVFRSRAKQFEIDWKAEREASGRHESRVNELEASIAEIEEGIHSLGDQLATTVPYRLIRELMGHVDIRGKTIETAKAIITDYVQRFKLQDLAELQASVSRKELDKVLEPEGT